MAETTGISWCDATFNHIRGCDKVSAGCDHCYAEAFSNRNPKVLGVWGPQAEGGTRVVASEDQWRQPIKWNREAEAAGVRRRVFCASLADVFEDWRGLLHHSGGDPLYVCDVCGAWRTMDNMCHGPIAHFALTTDGVRRRLFALIDKTPWLDWLLLTKRPENVDRLTRLAGRRSLPENVWLGTTVENQAVAVDRIRHLLAVEATVRFLSCEPLLEKVDLAAGLGCYFCNRCRLHTDGCGPWHCPNCGNEDADWDDESDPCPSCDEDTEAEMTCDRCGADGGNGGLDHNECWQRRVIDWVIVGGESTQGKNAGRPMDVSWVEDVVRQCRDAGTPVFVKQMGSNPTACGDGGELQQLTARGKGGSDVESFPEHLRIQEFPCAKIKTDETDETDET